MDKFNHNVFTATEHNKESLVIIKNNLSPLELCDLKKQMTFLQKK